MNVQKSAMCGLNCHLIDQLPDGTEASLAVVLCHGFGAPGTDLVSIGSELLSAYPRLGQALRFIFPEAPLSLEDYGMPGGRAWWPLDLERMTAAIERGELRDLRNDLPDGLAEAREKLTSLVEDVQQRHGLPTSRIVLGGFSQGAMLATDVTLRLPESPAGLCIFSGTLLCEQEWKPLAAERGPLLVVQSHGHQDPLLPFQAAEWLRELLTDAGFDVDFVPFAGPHTIPVEALQHFAALLSRLTTD